MNIFDLDMTREGTSTLGTARSLVVSNAARDMGSVVHRLSFPRTACMLQGQLLHPLPPYHEWRELLVPLEGRIVNHSQPGTE